MQSRCWRKAATEEAHGRPEGPQKWVDAKSLLEEGSH